MPEKKLAADISEVTRSSDDAVALNSARLCGPRVPEFLDRTFPEIFAAQVAQHPDKIAVICGKQQLTYDELSTRSNQVARRLRELGIARESIVGICIDRSIDMVVGIVGILKAGAAYLPLDPDYPGDRLEFMIKDARPSAVLTNSSLAQLMSNGAAATILLDNDRSEIDRDSVGDLPDGPSPNHLAYVIYTSGSTGQPKGVMIEHRNLANYLLGLDRELHISPDDCYLHTASIAFSSSRRQLLLPLTQGATVVIASADERKDPLALFRTIKERRVTVMDAVPSFWRNCTSMLASLDDATRAQLLDNDLRLMLSASEPLASDIPRTWIQTFKHRAQHVHMFGQTETAGIVALYRVPEDVEGGHVVPIGQPIANTEIFILDEERRACAAGTAGELYIGGAGVGRGYLNQPELTSEKFIKYPLRDDADARLYRAGDWAKLNTDGWIEYAGRRDQQVKLRGFRVELGEIEAALVGHPAISEAVVVARTDTNDETRLVGYFVPDGSGPNVTELRAFLSSRLPTYEVPQTFVTLEALPRSPNGKIDRLALPDPDNARPDLATAYLAPRNDLERDLAEIWSEVLRIERIGVSDNFFELGGNSLLATQMSARVRKSLGIEMPIRLVFEHPNIACLADAIEKFSAIDCASTPTANHRSSAPLSFNQQQFWVLDQAESNSHYNVRTALKIVGPLDLAKLQNAFNSLISRHEILRTAFVMNGDSPRQLINRSLPFSLNVRDLSNLNAAEREFETKRAFESASETIFDLSQEPLMRAQVLKFDRSEHVLLLTFHHIICDGWSLEVLLRDLMALYRSEELPSLAIQYADYSTWQRERAEDETAQRGLEYWKQKLAGMPVLELPADFERPAIRTFNGASESAVIARDLSDAIKNLRRKHGATTFMTLLAAFQTLLARYSGQTDVAIGSPVAGRALVESENVAGPFVNTIVLRGDLSGNPTFRELLARVRETALEAYSHQDIPFEKVVAELRPERSPNRSPLFDLMFSLRSPQPQLKAPGLQIQPMNLDNVKSKFDLSLVVEDAPEGLRLSLEYNTDLFVAETIQQMLRSFQNLLAAAITDPVKRLSELSLLTETERQQLIVECNRTAMESADDRCIHELFEAQVQRTPEAIAAEFAGQQMTYGELNSRANQLAGYLKSVGVRKEVLVGICVERSLEMLIGVLGVLKAGGAYVPLDPTYPRERLAYMIEDAALSVIVTQDRLAKDIPITSQGQLIRVDADANIIARESTENPAIATASENLAYVIYTSGSTGTPKGVSVEHASVVNFIRAAIDAYGIRSRDRVLQFASICFDLSVEEIFPALSVGATVVLRNDAMISSPRDFFDQCVAWRITVLDLPTAYWHELVDALDREKLKFPESVRLTIIGGESASREHVRLWQKLLGESVQLLNSYGPTETTVAATVTELKTSDDARGRVSIGRAVRNTTLFVLDETLEPVPPGLPGELYIGGAGVARGYLNRPELTAEKFIRNPFGPGRLYRTGDLVRHGGDRNLEFIGRVDNQVKIRGFRVELGEIEQALRKHPRVNDCVVILDSENSSDKTLIAYIVASDSSSKPAELRNFLKSRLPSYMVPAIFEPIDALPLTPNGKIDRRALPKPSSSRTQFDEEFVAPRTPTEEFVAGAYAKVLGIDRLGIYENFFDAGGHSLLAARLVSTLRTDLNVQLAMVDVFQAPTIASLAELLCTRITQNQEEDELARLLEEVAGLTDEEAQQQMAAENLAA